MNGKLDNTGHEVIDLPRSAYHEVKPMLFNPERTEWSTHAYALGLHWRLRVQAAAFEADPRAFVKLTGC